MSTKEAQFFKEMIQEEMLSLPAIKDNHKIFPNIPYNTNINILGNLGLVGVADAGCAMNPSTSALDVTTKVWTPKKWKIFHRECYFDYEGGLLEPQMNILEDRADLVRTELISLLQDKFKPAMAEMLLRYIWFNDTLAANTDDSPAGLITPTTDVKYFNVYDGLFKQLLAICTADATRHITIAANAELTYALQDSTLTPTLAYGYIVDAIYKASIMTKAKPGYKVLCTQELYDKATQYTIGKDLPAIFERMENGISQFKVLGKVVEPMPMWSQYIRAYEDNGTTWNKPHRLLYFNPENLGIAVPKNDIVLNTSIIFDPIQDYTYLKASGVMDMKVIVDKNIQYGY